LKKYFRATEKSEAFGRSFEIAHKDYKEALEWKGFCGGLQEYAYWWPKDAFFHILQSLGFKSIEVGFDHPDHPNGPAFAICASDSDLPARIDSKSLRNEIPAMSKTRTSQWYFSFGQHFRLMLSIVGREIVGRYRGSAFGILWSLLTPLFMLSIYTFVFGVVMKAKWSVPGGQVREHSTAEFAVILFSGLLVFQFFSEVVGAAPGRILSNVNYVKKVVFPIEILPVVSVGVALFHVGVSLLVLLLFSAFVFGLPATLPLAPLVFAPFVLLTLGLAWFFAAVGVYLRDIGQIIGPVLTASMFLSPIFFPRTALPDWLQPWLIFHPLTIPVETFRNVVVFGVQPDWIALAVYTCVAALVAMLGYLFFQKTRRGFADVL
jgi:lipopolysaccharide transport system permease protein